MERLKKQVIKFFLLFSFAIALMESVVDSLFDDYLFLVIEDNTQQMQLLLISYVVISILVFVLFAFWFSKVINKKIKEETSRQVNEKNLLYANITHDLKTPITSILGFSRALKDSKVEKEQMEEIVNTIYEKSKRTDELINVLFHYSKLENDEYVLEFNSYDICALIRKLIAAVYEEMEEKKIDLEIHIPEEKIMCKIDYIELQRAVNNLLVNAYKHNEKGSKVRITVTEKEGKVKIEVADNGKKIEPESVERIFEPFVCGDESRNINNGSGLGLAISKKIIERHGGALYIVHNISGYTKAFVVELQNNFI